MQLALIYVIKNRVPAQLREFGIGLLRRAFKIETEIIFPFIAHKPAFTAMPHKRHQIDYDRLWLKNSEEIKKLNDFNPVTRAKVHPA